MTSLSVQNYAFAYGAKAILQDISFGPIPQGKLVGLLGANGVGKSTFLRSIAGLAKFQGLVELDQKDLQGQSMYQRMRRVGYMPQILPQPTSLTAYESVFTACRAVRPDLSKQAVENRLEQVFTDLNIRDLAFKTLANMSGGQKQMVGLAQTIIKKPELLLLDEPTSALDLRWQMSVFDLVKQFLRDQQAICVMAIHDINLAMRHCDYIALFAEGSLLSFGTAAEAVTAETLAAAYGVAATIEQSQTGIAYALVHGLSK